MLASSSIGPGDVVAVPASPAGQVVEMVASVVEARAALFPIDLRLPDASTMLERCRPTHRYDAGELVREARGIACDPDVALIVATSGAAGAPRLVELTRAAVQAAVDASIAALTATRDDGWLACLPLHHIGGFLVVLRALSVNAPLTVHDSFDVDEFAMAAADGRVQFTSVVPTMVVRLLDAGIDMSHLRTILVGGASIDDRLRARMRAQGGPWLRTYGQTQCCGGVVYGGVPLPGVAVRIGEGSEIELAGSTIMRGYRLEPQATRAAFTDDGWLRTGDAGRIDSEGRLHVDGRLDDLIITGGENVWPSVVEGVLATHPSVADVAVAGRPDPEWGSRVVAFVVPVNAQSPPQLVELRDHVAERLPRHAAPRELVIVRELRRTALGKIRRGDL